MAQNYSVLTKSDTLSIDSRIFESIRKVIITKFKGVIEDDKPNCIIYLDAHWLNETILLAADDLILAKEIPESVLVGIIPENREKELTEKDYLSKFITEELIPYLSKEYSISSNITIAFYSFGGYFATHLFLQKNDIFNSCIAISPTYWPNNCEILELMERKSKDKSISGNLYLAIGDRRWVEVSVRDFVFKAKTILEKDNNIRFKFNDLEGFSHSSTPTVGFGLGLGFIFDEWEWGNILEEQNEYLRVYPRSWGHLELKGDALWHMRRKIEAREFYDKALSNLSEDQELSVEKEVEIRERLEEKIKNCH
ncbi:alpha/beta hydrolase-fold protein [Proteiniphilum sp. X52]|uniref:alpha/beta hydrolase-fold protein n=1 Tax=Proteiniphilum sp. X52 TaxID=2382159 RepID=UPI000F0A2857|nr:alpha/beta hydrolase-fold protein [Proteiniphilum sp. X52]RNC64871.1 hypothetical protein D7D25_09630 [Proteiniphilum sp. X52]